jgi:hypothetical protein
MRLFHVALLAIGMLGLGYLIHGALHGSAVALLILVGVTVSAAK